MPLNNLIISMVHKLIMETKEIFDVIIEEDLETNQFYAYTPQLPGCYSTGETVEELLTNIKEAIELHIATEKEKNEPLKFKSRIYGLLKVTV